MGTQFESCEKHYEKVVNYFTQQYQFKLITYDNFFIGYDLFKIGVCMGFKASTSILMHYLETAHVQTNTMDESQNVLALQQFMATEFSENIKQL